jgi:hypothetical protein
VHLKNSWDPRMRRQIFQHVEETGGGDLKELVRAAVLTLEMAPARREEAPGDD